MNTLAIADESPPRTFGIRAVRESWVPRDWHADCPAIDQVDDQRIVGEPDSLRTRFADFTR